jgi:hypothetical protein
MWRQGVLLAALLLAEATYLHASNAIRCYPYVYTPHAWLTSGAFLPQNLLFVVAQALMMAAAGRLLLKHQASYPCMLLLLILACPHSQLTSGAFLPQNLLLVEAHASMMAAALAAYRTSPLTSQMTACRQA